MELRYLLRLTFVHRRLLAVSTMVAGLLALAITYVLPEKFEASTIVLIRPRKEPASDQASKAMMDYPVSFNIPVDTMSKTYAEIMGSHAVASRVVDLLHLDTARPPRDPRLWKRLLQEGRDFAKIAVARTWALLRYGRIEPDDPYRDAVDNVMKGLQARPITDTFLFSLKAVASDADLSARIANTAASVFIDYTRAARMDEEGTGVRDIQQRVSTVRTDLDGARARLQAFGRDTAAASLDRQLQLRLDDLARFQADRENAVRELQGLEAETATLERQLTSLREAVPLSTTVARNPVVTEIEVAVAKYEIEYAGLSDTLQPDHPRMRELKAQMDEARRRLADALPQVPDRDTSTLNQTREQVTQRLLERSANRDAVLARRAALDRTIEEYRARVDALTRQKGSLSQLTLDVEVLESEYRLLNREQAEASLAAIQQVGEIRQLHAAVAPVYPARPIKVYYAAAGLSLGFLLALFSILLLDYVEPRVHHLDDAQPFGVPFVAVIPHARAVPELFPAPSDAAALAFEGVHRRTGDRA